MLLAIHDLDEISVPWDEVGKRMGENITGDAVLKYITELRDNINGQRLSVTPLLGQGGDGCRISRPTSSSPLTVEMASRKSSKEEPTPTKRLGIVHRSYARTRRRSRPMTAE